MRLGWLLAAALGVCACRPTLGGPTADADHRVPPAAPKTDAATGLTFPLEPASPTALVAVPAFPGLRLSRPVFVTWAPGEPDRLYAVEQAGRILAFDRRADVEHADTFLDIRDRVRMVHNEEGLLGLAFAPDYPQSGAFYVYYSASGPRRIQISRFSRGPDGRGDPASESKVLTAEQPWGNHNGGMLTFGPDGALYAGIGDGGAAGDPRGAGQDLSTILGSIVRLEVHGDAAGYRIPADNPMVDVRGARPEIYAYGLRNPWRFSFDRATGELWVGDVGQDRIEEIDRVVAGGNYGWRLKEGSRKFRPARGGRAADLIDPVIEYGRRDGESVTGGYVYRGTHLSAFRGAYFYGDYVTGNVWALVHDGTQVVSNRLVARVPALASFGEDARGELYAVSDEGRIYRFEPAAPRDAAPAFPTRLSQTGLFTDTAALQPNPALVPYEVNAPLWSDGADKRRWLVLPPGTAIEFSPTDAWRFPVGTVVVKHFALPTTDAPGAHPLRRLETRVMVHERYGWAGYTYRWNEAQTDAELVTAPHTATHPVRRAGVDVAQPWPYPAGSDCLRCHTGSYGPVLGLRTRQLNRTVDGRNLLADWNARKMFDRDIGDPSRYEAFAAVDAEGASVPDRVRAYLDVNCAVCHHPGGPAPGSVDLRFDTPLPDTHLLGVAPEEGLGVEGERRIVAGDHRRSSLWLRLSTRDRESMPPLSSNVVDRQAVALIGRFIDAL